MTLVRCVDDATHLICVKMLLSIYPIDVNFSKQ